ncbi:MAG: metallophosphoesterase family protein, partial [Anaerolineales bacterium]
MIGSGVKRLSRLALIGGLTVLACARSDLPFNPARTLPPSTATHTSSPIPSLLPAPIPSPATISPPEPTLSPSPSATATTTPTATPVAEIGYTTSAASVSYRIPLTLRHVTSETAILYFELEVPAAGYLLYRPTTTGSAGWFVHALDPAAVRHQVELVGLSAGAAYQARVGLGESLSDLRAPWLFGARWGDVSFESAATDSPELRIGVIGDSGYGQRSTWDLAELMASYRLDFVLHTGDLAYRVNEEADPFEGYAKKYFLNLAPLLTGLPIYPVPGNHEYDRETYWLDRPFYFYAFAGVGIQGAANESWYSFSRAGIQFLMLDSQVFHGAAGRASQTAWVAERLADSNFRFSIPVFHTPPFTSGLHRNDGTALAAEWLPRFEAAGVPLVLSGHDHNFERILFNGITYVVSGGGSRTLYPDSGFVPGSQAFAMQTHFVLLE